MRISVYGAVLLIALGSVLLELDWLSVPMSPMVDTEAGLHAKPAPAPTVAQQPPVNSGGTIGAPIIPLGLTAPTPPAPATAEVGADAQATPPIAEPEPQVPCNVEACTAAYRSFRSADCTYLPVGGPRRLCTK